MRILVFILLAVVLLFPMVFPLSLPFGDEIPNLAASAPSLESSNRTRSYSGGMPPAGMMKKGGMSSADAGVPEEVPFPEALVFRPKTPDLSLPPVERLYRTVDSLPPGTLVLVGVDFGASRQAEMLPLLADISRHILQGRRRMLVVALVDQGPLLATATLRNVSASLGSVYGTDWALLGIIPGEETALLRFGRDMRSVFTTDLFGAPIDTLPIMDGVNSVAQLSLAIDLSDGEGMPVSYIKMLGSSGLPIGAGLSASAAPGLMPYIQSGQIIGMAAGLPGAAHYERLGGGKGLGTSALDALSLGGAFILLLIVIGNFFTGKRT